MANPNPIVQRVLGRTRTGQGPGMMSPSPVPTSTASRTPMNSDQPGGAPGACGTAPGGNVSWGSGCPSGYCLPADLPASLGRVFAGEARGCREIPLSFYGTVDANGDLVFDGNAPITICPTRLIIVSDGDPLFLSSIKFGNEPQMIGNEPIYSTVFAQNAWGAIPFVMNCLKAGLPYNITLSSGTPDDNITVVLLGPAIG